MKKTIQTISNSQLQEAATAALQATAEEFQIPQSLGDGYAMEWGPVIDGDYLPTNPVTEEGFAEAGRDVPLLIGSNLNEWSGFTGGAEASEVVTAAFAEAYPNEEISNAGMVDSTIIRLPLLKIMSHKADQNGANVYAYVFTRQVGDYGSYHGAEIPFVFRNTQEESGLVDTVSSAWVSFARSGVPSAEGLEEWKPYTREDGATMILDEESYLAHGHDRALMELLAPGYEY